MILNEILKNKRVLVIGDSFISILDTPFSWLNRLRIHFNWSVDDRSVMGSGSHYTFYEFLNNQEDFDVCIFAWSEPSRLFIPAVPWLNSSEVQHKNHMESWQKDIYRAAQHYYMHLLNHDMEVYKNTAMLYWLDSQLKEKYSDKYFFHFHSFPKPLHSEDNIYESVKEHSDPNFYHTFANGINLSPSLLKLSTLDPDCPDDYAFDQRPGHLSKTMHDKIFYRLVDYFKKNDYINGDIIEVNV
jgi:hypothetical protein